MMKEFYFAGGLPGLMSRLLRGLEEEGLVGRGDGDGEGEDER